MYYLDEYSAAYNIFSIYDYEHVSVVSYSCPGSRSINDA